MKKIGWVYKCDIDKIFFWGFGNALEVDADHAPVNTKSSLESECETHGKSCKPIKVVVEVRRAK